METTGITILGLGPGNQDYLTRRAWRILNTAEEIYLRTIHHPVVPDLPAGLRKHSFDAVYDEAEKFEDVYEQIVAEVLRLGKRPEGIIYAVPGHPFVAEATCPEIVRQAKRTGIPVQVVEGISFIAPLLTAVGVDAFPHMALLDAFELSKKHMPPFPPSSPAIIAQIHSRMVASEVKLSLMGVYSDDFPVKLIHAAGTDQEIVEELQLFEIDRSEHIGLLTALYLPGMDAATSFEAFQNVIAHLRAPDGCPWDQEQTHQSLRPHLLEEAYEALSALDNEDPEAMREEFGDLLLQIVLHGVHTKLVSRHPHVFGDLVLEEPESVLLNWEKLKAEERAANGNNNASLLDGVALALPALVQAEQFQLRAGRVGFDWPDIAGVYNKIEEELAEIHTAVGKINQSAEIGDLLFAVVNLARWLGIDAESSLREANTRFRNRFSKIESEARAQGRVVSDMTLNEMESIWRAAKNKPL
jgi:tetrapyrrole methylase family protein/MazG family protein